MGSALCLALVGLAVVAGCTGLPDTTSLPATSALPAKSSPRATSSLPVTPSLPSGERASLVVFSDPGGHPTLEIRGPGGATVSVPPPGEPRWIAVDATRRLVATLAGGRLMRTTARPTRAATWVPIPVDPVAPIRDPLSFAVPDRSSGRIAALAAAFGSGEPASLVVIDPAGGAARTIPLGVEVAGAAPAWLDERRVAVVALPASGRPRLLIVDVDAASVRPAADGISAIAVSGDGGRIATVAPDRRTIELHETAAWLASPDGPPLGRIELPATGIVTSLAADPAGSSLAVTWTDADLVPAAVVRYDEASGWHEAVRVDLAPGTSRAVVAWLPSDGGAVPP